MRTVPIACVIFVFATISPAAAQNFTLGPMGTARAGNDNKVWDAHCARDNEKVISGMCVINPGSGAHPLQNVGPDESLKIWTCVWTQHINSATARALCAN
jgi:hypothetical protein